MMRADILVKERRVLSSLSIIAKLVSVIVVLATAEAAVSAATIKYTAINLTDLEADKDLWRYQYEVSGYDFKADDGFSIYFEYDLFQDLQDPEPILDPISPTWDALVEERALNEVGGVTSPGIYDVLSFYSSGNAPLDVIFGVNFVWLGSGTPGSQAFEIYHLDLDNPIETLDADGNPLPPTYPPIVDFSGDTEPVPDAGSTAVALLLSISILVLSRRLEKELT